jgi:FixJ family two-component response regulator
MSSLAISRSNNRFRGESDEAAANTATAAVYLVDRDLPTVEYLSEQLTMCGYLVNCFDTIDQYAQFPRPALPSCLIVDADGADIDMLRLQQGLKDGTQAPLILTSAYPDIAQVVRSIRAGALDFLTKPLSIDSIVCAVRAAIEQDMRHGQSRAALERVASRVARLTPRESQLLPLLVSGLLNKQSAARLGISEITVKVHRRHIMEKLQASSLADLVRMTAHLDLHLIQMRSPAPTQAPIPAYRREQERQSAPMLL